MNQSTLALNKPSKAENIKRKESLRRWYLQNTMDTWMYSKKKKKQSYPLTDQEWTWTSNAKKDKDYQSKRYMQSFTTNWKNSGTPSSQMKKDDGYEKHSVRGDLL